MKHQFFVISALEPSEGQEALNRFCAAHRVVAVERQFVADGPASFWSLCVTYQDSAGGPQGQRKSRVDYKELLSEQEFTAFARLRTLRKELSEQEGVPAYALFTNEQLADMVRRHVDSLAAMAEIEGVGPARIEKYGERFIEALKSAGLPESNGSS